VGADLGNGRIDVGAQGQGSVVGEPVRVEAETRQQGGAAAADPALRHDAENPGIVLGILAHDEDSRYTCRGRALADRTPVAVEFRAGKMGMTVNHLKKSRVRK
jgi:hypothetical protein